MSNHPQPDPTRPLWSHDMDTQSTHPTCSHDDGSGRHPVNLTHLIMGIAFLGFAGIWAAVTGELVPADDLRWLLPVPWLLAGSTGLLALTVSQMRRTRRHGKVGMVSDHPVDPGSQEGPDLGGQVSER